MSLQPKSGSGSNRSSSSPSPAKVSFLRRSSPLVRPRRPLVKKEGEKKIPIKKETNGSLSGANSVKSESTSGSVKKETDNDEGVQSFKISACTKEEIANIQYHLMKFQSKKDVDPVKDFTRPMRLHRKDPRDMQFQLTLKEIEEREKLNEKLTNISGKQSDKNVAAVDYDGYVNGEGNVVEIMDETKIGPEGALVNNNNKWRNKNKKLTKEVRVVNEEARKLRYEEYYPWVIEDYDGSNTFVGNYEAASTVGHNHVLLVPTSDGGFKMVPINKIYKFTPRNKYATLTSEEAEQKMESKERFMGWDKLKLDDPMNNSRASRSNNARNHRMKVFGSSYGRDDDDDDAGGKRSDNEGMDFEDEFADDEEAPIVGENDDEEKDSRKRMEKEMQRANTGLNEVVDNDDDDDDDEDGLFGEKKTKFTEDGKKLKKALGKDKYGEIVYESEDEENPYLSQSDLESQNEDEVNDTTSGPKLEGGNESNGESSSVNKKINTAPQLSIKLPVNNPIGIVTILSNSKILTQFPKGEWNPAISKKRSHSALSSNGGQMEPNKRAKTKSPSPVMSKSGSPRSVTPLETEGSLITEEEVVSLIKSGELTTKELYNKLKEKIARNKANKELFKDLIKKLAKVKSNSAGVKILVLKK